MDQSVYQTTGRFKNNRSANLLKIRWTKQVNNVIQIFQSIGKEQETKVNIFGCIIGTPILEIALKA